MKTSPRPRWQPVPSRGDAEGGSDWIKHISGLLIQSEREVVARVFAAAFGASVGGATRHVGAAMVAAACREFHEHSISGPLQGPSVLDEVGQKVAVIEAGLRTHAALVGGRPTTALASAIGALRQLNRAVNDAKHGDEVCRPPADTAQTHMQHDTPNPPTSLDSEFSEDAVDRVEERGASPWTRSIGVQAACVRRASRRCQTDLPGLAPGVAPSALPPEAAGSQQGDVHSHMQELPVIDPTHDKELVAAVQGPGTGQAHSGTFPLAQEGSDLLRSTAAMLADMCARYDITTEELDTIAAERKAHERRADCVLGGAAPSGLTVVGREGPCAGTHSTSALARPSPSTPLRTGRAARRQPGGAAAPWPLGRAAPQQQRYHPSS